jgi:arylsulfatase A-like enzyme/lysophospholipase L1-like esterase
MKPILHLLCCLLTLPLAALAERPNVVILLADDQGWGDLSSNGNTNLRTPNIDALARDGVTLDRFYVCPVCAPTRAEFLTGRYHPRTGVRGVSTGQERLNLDEKTIADAFKAAGYATGAFGKWHNGSQWPYHPNARGFDEYYGFTSGHWGEYFDPPLEHNGQPVRGKGFIADDLTDHALAFIEKNRTKPFFCYLPYNTPHSPFAVPQKDWQRFKDQPLALKAREGDKEDPDQTRCVLAMSENIDQNVGRVLRRLDELKLSDNTIVIYFTDNGPNTFRWNGDMKGKKGTTDEGGVRSSFLIRWPVKLPSGRTVKEIAGAIDLLPTLTALAGVPRLGVAPLDGRDLSPLLLGKGESWPERMIFSTWGGNVSVRTPQYRLDNKGGLYDMLADPGQRTNIAASQPEVAARLVSAVADWRQQVLGGAPADAKGQGKMMDARPYPVGYAEFPRTTLPARDGVPNGTVRRSANAPNSSYFVNWTNKDDTMTWDIDVATAGEYAVEIQYTCPVPDAGSSIELSFLDSKLTGKVAPGWDPPLYTNQDTIPRPPAESQMKEFRPLALGTMRLAKGRGLLTLRALEIPGRSVMDVRSIALTLKTPARTKTTGLEPIQDVPGLPRVLIIGDSISIGYTQPVRDLLKGKANVHRIPQNGGPTKLGVQKIDAWLGASKWDVIHFNWGIHDLKFMPDGKRQVEPAEYEQNLRALVAKLKTTGAKLIWATITPIPNGELVPPRRFGDVAEYNAIARRVMKESGVAIDDLNDVITPQLATLQRPQDVHYTPEGSAFLAREVAKCLEAALAK